MGTNYYIKQRGNNEFSIHVGKMSCGWRFLMAGHLDDVFIGLDKTLIVAKFQDYIDLLRENKDYYLVNEYGRECNIHNLAKEINIEMLSNSFGLTPNYLSVLFKKETGKGIIEHITRLRIEKACDMLINTDHKVQYICTAVGISDYFYFTKLFKKYMQVTPTQYRTSQKDNEH